MARDSGQLLGAAAVVAALLFGVAGAIGAIGYLVSFGLCALIVWYAWTWQVPL